MKNRQRQPDSNREPIIGTINDAEQMLGCGRNLIYDMINAGALKKVKLGSRTMITIESIRLVAKNGFKKANTPNTVLTARHHAGEITVDYV